MGGLADDTEGSSQTKSAEQASVRSERDRSQLGMLAWRVSVQFSARIRNLAVKPTSVRVNRAATPYTNMPIFLILVMVPLREFSLFVIFPFLVTGS